ncbi:aldose 1-epimerase [Leptospira langatensis]|uniref:Aldose 1-epimerase n=1 Tax=Leptospira langatensis TaxID=2484983 RepID=A0A5F1ZXQ1_9LEPT|nr:aldose 1-epimerase [Leptospira langatensis]TGK04086.1 aldose 1-epimerase [Leptospira langatensis]TGL43566.1 aldose 1-epimerase [Leptospira langatensis]
MYEFRTEKSSFQTDGKQWFAWEWTPSSGKETVPIIFPYDPKRPIFESGSFLMFPWVNRHASSDFILNGRSIRDERIVRDNGGYPVHGAVHSLERKALKIRPDGKGGEFRVLFPEEWKDSPLSCVAIREEYSLEETAAGTLLSIKTRFNNLRSDSVRFAYGYHPYFSLVGDIADWNLKLTLDKNIELNENLVPIQPFISNPVNSIVSDGSIPELDHLFYGREPRVILENSKLKYSITIFSPHPEDGQIPLNYYQIYTKPDKTAIAIEPCSAPGNALLSGQDLKELKGYSETFGEFRILVRTA